jgi:elongator complex protein 3
MLEKIVKKIIKANPQTQEEFLKLKREFFYKYKIKQASNAELLKLYNKLVKKQSKGSDKFIEILKKRKIRTLSGVAPVAVLTKSYGCPGECVYCPTEKKMPKSYLSNEPAVMRAILCSFSPFRQVTVRIKALENNGHEAEKIELIVMGGTWSTFSEKYKYWYIKELFRAANSYGKRAKAQDNFSDLKLSDLKKELKKQQDKNETSKYRIVGLTLETRPDYINEKEILQFRKFGCTRVEIGVQAIDDKILKLNKRGHGVKGIVQATLMLKKAGFKINYHLMPNLPGSTPAKDLKMFKDIFYDKRFLPDQIKIYPCVVVKGAELYLWWKKGKYKPYTNKQLEDLLLKIKKITPYYIRIVRLIRDIPTVSIEAGNKVSNLRQTLQRRMAEDGESCKCIRCREAREREVKPGEEKLFIESYNALEGREYFISIESYDRKILYAFVRLRLPLPPMSFPRRRESQGNSSVIASKAKQSHGLQIEQDSFYKIFPELNNAGIIRELHTYGKLTPVNSGKGRAIQHQGFGKRLMIEAEKITKKAGLKKMAVISGIGVREYYKKIGYNLEGTYMVKDLDD